MATIPPNFIRSITGPEVYNKTTGEGNRAPRLTIGEGIDLVYDQSVPENRILITSASFANAITGAMDAINAKIDFTGSVGLSSYEVSPVPRFADTFTAESGSINIFTIDKELIGSANNAVVIFDAGALIKITGDGSTAYMKTLGGVYSTVDGVILDQNDGYVFNDGEATFTASGSTTQLLFTLESSTGSTDHLGNISVSIGKIYYDAP